MDGELVGGGRVGGWMTLIPARSACPPFVTAIISHVSRCRSHPKRTGFPCSSAGDNRISIVGGFSSASSSSWKLVMLSASKSGLSDVG